MSGAVGGAIVIAILAGTVGYLFGVMTLGIRRQVRGSNARAWRDFGLSISLAVLFLATWLGQGISQWQQFTDEQSQHGEPVLIGDFLTAFGSSTLENWQSEFLQLFSFVVLSAVLIHMGSAESKDSDDRMEQALERIEARLGTTPENPSLDDVRPDAGPLLPDRMPWAGSHDDDDSASGTRRELYERAQTLGVEGRSRMNKQELEDAIKAMEGEDV